MRYWLTRATMPMPLLTAFRSLVRRRSFHPGAIVWCSEVMIDICIRSAIWASGFLIGSSNSEESQLGMKSWRVPNCRFSTWFVLISGLLDCYNALAQQAAEREIRRVQGLALPARESCPCAGRGMSHVFASSTPEESFGHRLAHSPCTAVPCCRGCAGGVSFGGTARAAG